MDNLQLTSLMVIGLILFGWVAWGFLFPSKTGGRSTRDNYETHERARMPPEVATGKLVISEETFRYHGDRPFAAKTDQGFLTREGWLVLVETKGRSYISPSDIVQISAQALAVANHPKKKWNVAAWGYIRLDPAGGKPYYKRVRLMPPVEIFQLWDRWRALKEGRVNPIARPAQYRCPSCALRTSCPVAVRGRASR